MVEDEVHFTVDCDMYVNDRNTLFSYIEGRFPHFRHMSSADKFIFPMRFDKLTIAKPIQSYIFTITKKLEEAKLLC